MEIELIKIGNSRGIRIPAAIIEQCGLKGSLQLEVKDNKVVISASKTSLREQWIEDFERLGPPPIEWDENPDLVGDEWTW